MVAAIVAGAWMDCLPDQSVSTHLEMQLENPYRSPETVLEAPPESLDQNQGNVTAAQIVMARQGLSGVIVCVALATAVMLSILFGLLFQNGTADNQRSVLTHVLRMIGGWGILPYLVVLLFAIFLPFSCLRVAQAVSKHRQLSLLAIVLYYVAGILVLVGVMQVHRIGALIGLTPLFLASAYSTFLIAVALMLLTQRELAKMCHDTVPVKLTGLAIFCFAVSGVATTTLAMARELRFGFQFASEPVASGLSVAVLSVVLGFMLWLAIGCRLRFRSLVQLTATEEKA
ncbi:MAG: hypothetical protein CBB71_05720 [Rhodopirellula sp. TMED11]|nr:MAG: hypothetical protein CBB71_05720 [Rhodopirellula sp. TMED11]